MEQAATQRLGVSCFDGITVPPEHAGIRLDKFLSLALPQFTRSRLQQLIEGGAVERLNSENRLARSAPPLRGSQNPPWDFGGGEIERIEPLVIPPTDAPKSAPTPPQGGSYRASGAPITNAASKVKAGETYTLTVPETVPMNLAPEKIALDIVYEDAHLLVINKPAGMTVHPAPGAYSGTLVHALLSHCGDSLSGIGGVARPGIVHRIDKDTTGLLVVAKNDAAHQHLSSQLKDRTLKRRYIALCWGAPTPRAGEVDAPLARNPRMRKQMAVVENGRHALTHYETQQSYNAPGFIVPLASRIACELDTGRTHQIRVHMAHKKAPLIGDATYGQTTTTRLNRLKSQGVKLSEPLIAVLQGFKRQALHAAELTLIHPKTNEEMHFVAPIPEDMVALERALSTLTK